MIFGFQITGDKNFDKTLFDLTFGSLKLILSGIAFYVSPLILVLIACKFTISKPSTQAKTFRYASPVLGAILLFYCYTFGTSFYVTPGLIIPHNLRHIWVGMQIPRYYEHAEWAIAQVKSCPLITDTIGEVEGIAVAEKLNFMSIIINDNWISSSLEVVGKRGTAIIKDCATRAYCPTNLYADTKNLHQNLSGKQIYYAQCDEAL